MAAGQMVVALKLPGMDEAIVKKDIPYLNNSGLIRKLDIYYPPKFDFKSSIPAIIFISGCPDTSMVKLIGSEFRKANAYTSWCKLVAASGMAAIVYETMDPKNDLVSLAEYLNSNLEKLSIKKGSIGGFVCSGHTPNAVSYILNSPSNIFNCAALYYGFSLPKDSEFNSKIEVLFQQQGFQKPPILTDPSSWNKNVPLLIVRAGQDKVPFVNQSMQIFINTSITQNLPITIINFPDGPHGFDVYTETETAKLIISKTLEFWKQNLKAN